MAADWTITEGDTEPVFYDELTYSNKEKVDLTGATVEFVMRSLTSGSPLSLTGSVEIIAATEGKLAYLPSAKDTAIAGAYMAQWRITFSGGETMTFPTVGYLSVEVQESLNAAPQQLISLEVAKQHIGIPANDHVNDSRLLRCIESVSVLIENMVGPIRLTQREEWHDGGNYFIQLRRRPSTAFGTTPVMKLIACIEYRGPIPYELSIIANPAFGSIYSVHLDELKGTVTRRTSGGGVMAFPAQSEAVQVFYQAGQEVVPANIQEAMLEAVKLNFVNTVAAGRGAMAASEEEQGPPLGFYLPRRCLELIRPQRRHPSIF